MKMKETRPSFLGKTKKAEYLCMCSVRGMSTLELDTALLSPCHCQPQKIKMNTNSLLIEGMGIGEYLSSLVKHIKIWL
jgi:hypothetical protein